MSSTDQNRQAFAAAAQATLADSGPFSWTPWTAQEFAMMVSASHPHYRVEAYVNRGGMGAVYRATNARDGRSVAIKVMQPGLGAEYVERFQREIQILRGLSHPQVIPILDRGLTAGGSPFLVMPFLEGRTLAQFIASGQRLPMPRLLQLMQQLCDGIAHAHEKGIIHRDLKPANIFLTDPDESAVILDFGIARLLVSTDGLHTQSGIVHGTLGYLAPEVRQGRKAEKTADIYSLGVILYQLITGQLPEGNYAQPSAFGLDPRFDTILSRALNSDPNRRYACADDLAKSLHQLTKDMSYESFWRPIAKINKLKISAAISVLVFGIFFIMKVSELVTRQSEARRNETRLIQEQKFKLLERIRENKFERMKVESTYADCIKRDQDMQKNVETVKKAKNASFGEQFIGGWFLGAAIGDRIKNEERHQRYQAEKVRLDQEERMLNQELQSLGLELSK